MRQVSKTLPRSRDIGNIKELTVLSAAFPANFSLARYAVLRSLVSNAALSPKLSKSNSYWYRSYYHPAGQTPDSSRTTRNDNIFHLRSNSLDCMQNLSCHFGGWVYAYWKMLRGKERERLGKITFFNEGFGPGALAKACQCRGRLRRRGARQRCCRPPPQRVN